MKKKNEVAKRKPSLMPQGSFMIPLQHSHDFPITDRLVKSDALNALSSKFSIPPFSIDNLEDTYMLVVGQDIWLFKFIEVQNQVAANFQGVSRSSHDKGLCSVRYIRLQICGIDAPPSDTIYNLEKIVEEQLQQTSLAKLADSLIKNQKKTMTPNDYQFILGSASPEVLFCPIPLIITDFDLLISMTKQNLLRFLLSFKIVLKTMELIVMIYNYLTIIDSNISKNNRNQLYKHYTINTNYLENIFGKALAMISIETVYFDGENITEAKNDQISKPWVCTNSDIQMLQKYSGLAKPSTPGYYLEVKIYKNGNFNSLAFQEQMNSCISQSIFEYILEKILTSPQGSNIDEQYSYISEFGLSAMLNSLKTPYVDIYHYTNWSNLFLFYSQIIQIAEVHLDYKIKFRYGISEKSINKSSSTLKDIEDA